MAGPLYAGWSVKYLTEMTADELYSARVLHLPLYCQTMIRRSNVDPRRTVRTDIEELSEGILALSVSKLRAKGWVEDGVPFRRRYSAELTQITTDGKTVWVNGPNGCLGRFSRHGVDVHRDPADPQSGPHCLDCSPEPDWNRFKESMKLYHGVIVPDHYRPGGPSDPIWLGLEKLLDRYPDVSPFSVHAECTGGGGGAFREMTESMVASRTMHRHSYTGDSDFLSWTSERHAARISWLFHNPDPTPLRACLATRRLWIDDGYHRLGAAILRGDRTVSVVLESSDTASMASLLELMADFDE